MPKTKGWKKEGLEVRVRIRKENKESRKGVQAGYNWYCIVITNTTLPQLLVDVA